MAFMRSVITLHAAGTFCHRPFQGENALSERGVGFLGDWGTCLPSFIVGKRIPKVSGELLNITDWDVLPGGRPSAHRS